MESEEGHVCNVSVCDLSGNQLVRIKSKFIWQVVPVAIHYLFGVQVKRVRDLQTLEGGFGGDQVGDFIAGFGIGNVDVD